MRKIVALYIGSVTHMKCKNFEYLNIEFKDLFHEPVSERFEVSSF